MRCVAPRKARYFVVRTFAELMARRKGTEGIGVQSLSLPTSGTTSGKIAVEIEKNADGSRLTPDDIRRQLRAKLPEATTADLTETVKSVKDGKAVTIAKVGYGQFAVHDLADLWSAECSIAAGIAIPDDSAPAPPARRNGRSRLTTTVDATGNGSPAETTAS